MENKSFIIHNSFSFPECGNMKIRIFFIQITKSIMLMSYVKVDKLQIGFGMFKIRMCKKDQRIFQFFRDFLKITDLILFLKV